MLNREEQASAHPNASGHHELGLLTYGVQWSNKLTLKGLEKTFQSAIDHIEDETDKLAERIFLQIAG